MKHDEKGTEPDVSRGMGCLLPSLLPAAAAFFLPLPSFLPQWQRSASRARMFCIAFTQLSVTASHRIRFLKLGVIKAENGF